MMRPRGAGPVSRPGDSCQRTPPQGGITVIRTVNLRGRIGLAAVLALIVLLVAIPAVARSSSTTLPNGAQLTVSITSPADGTQFLADGAPVPVPLTGTASVGVGAAPGTIHLHIGAS